VHLFAKSSAFQWPFDCSFKTGVEGATRTVLGLALVIVLLGLAGKLFSFGSLIVQGGRSQPAISVADLESRLKEQNVFGRVGDARTKLSCEQAPAPWDFVCSFEPTPQTSTTRVKFGVRVTSSGGIFEFSALTPAVADLPAPVKGYGG
jgi:hypothetical protein